jgi:hypothetical protein
VPRAQDRQIFLELLALLGAELLAGLIEIRLEGVDRLAVALELLRDDTEVAQNLPRRGVGVGGLEFAVGLFVATGILTGQVADALAEAATRVLADLDLWGFLFLLAAFALPLPAAARLSLSFALLGALVASGFGARLVLLARGSLGMCATGQREDEQACAEPRRSPSMMHRRAAHCSGHRFPS